MPIAASSTICLSRATGSRPVQPAMTACRIDSVSGVFLPFVSNVKEISITDHSLHCSRQFENAAVRGADGFAAKDAQGHPGIVDVALAGDQVTMPGITFDRGEPALGVHLRHIMEFRHRDPLDQRAMA